MATTKKQVSATKKPKGKVVTADEKVKSTAVSKLKTAEAEDSSVEVSSEFLSSQRVWPD